MALSTSAKGVCAAALIVGLCPISARAATPEDGRKAYDAGHFNDATGIWAELNRRGSATSAYGLGLMYDLGNGTAANAETAFFWYKTAADAGLLAAEFNVGVMYDSGRGVARNPEAAALWYAKAAARGHARAQYNIGQLYDRGDGVPHNLDAAIAWLKKAAEDGIPAAASELQVLKATAVVRPTGPAIAVSLVTPAPGAALVPTDGLPLAELVWIAPPDPQPVHYEFKVRQWKNSSSTALLTGSLNETATSLRLPAEPALYEWGVDVVTADGKHVVSDWNRFSVVSPISASER